MIQYEIFTEPDREHEIIFDAKIPIDGLEVLKVQLPAWRPGRYELADFAKNVLRFEAKDEKGKELIYEKLSKDLWIIKCNKNKYARIRYTYFANEINAGSSFSNHDLFYINPVNCMFYLPDKLDTSYEIKLKLPQSFIVVSHLGKKGKKFVAHDHHELYDNPIVASKDLQIEQITVSGTRINLVIWGNCKPDFKRIKTDFQKFIQRQVRDFGSIPIQDFSFICLIPNLRYYHGVEHQKCTMLVYGPGPSLMNEEGYFEFLGLSSHEFYHIWNVKYIRPRELSPYDYAKENYHSVGYIIEGITTYMGELKLLQSKIYSEKKYLDNFQRLIERHLHNYGRYNYSLRQSSFDTWLDGYKKNAPDRNVSIYNEGSLFAFILDVWIMKVTKTKKRLDHVMRKLYEDYGGRKSGYTENDFWNVVENVSGMSCQYRKILDRSISLESELNAALAFLGLKIFKKDSDYLSSKMGVKANNENGEVIAVYPGSPGYKAGIRQGDEILVVNSNSTKNNTKNWAEFYSGNDLKIEWNQNGQLRKVILKPLKESFYSHCSIFKIENNSKDQQNHWRHFKL